MKFRTIGDARNEPLQDKAEIRVAIERRDRDLLQAIATRNNTSIAEIVRTLIRDYLSQRTSTR